MDLVCAAHRQVDPMILSSMETYAGKILPISDACAERMGPIGPSGRPSCRPTEDREYDYEARCVCRDGEMDADV